MASHLLTRLFAITPPAAPAPKGGIHAAAAPAAGEAPASGAFISTQSLANFPGAVLVINVSWVLAKRLGGRDAQWANTEWFVFWAALVVGTVVFLINLETTNPPPKSFKQWAIAIFVALINCLFLAASALGVDTTLKDKPEGGSNQGAHSPATPGTTPPSANGATPGTNP